MICSVRPQKRIFFIFLWPCESLFLWSSWSPCLQGKKGPPKRRCISITLKGATSPVKSYHAHKPLNLTSLQTGQVHLCTTFFLTRVRVIWRSSTTGFEKQYTYKHTKILNFIYIILIHICITSIKLEYRKHECVHRSSQFL